jgi:sRNA-binding carbon storage regulator CsrA
MANSGADMLVLSLAIGESVIIRDSTIANAAVIGPDFAELVLMSSSGKRLGSVTIGFTQSEPIAHGVTGVLLRVKAGKARIGFEMPRGVFVERLDRRDA